MRIYSSLHLLGALGVLTAASTLAAAADPSQWKCESCPYPKGVSGSVDLGLGYVSEASDKFGDYTGLQRRGAHLVLGGAVSRRGDDGYYADLSAADLGIDSRRLLGQSGREGLYSLQLGYSEIPRHLSNGAATPFLGNGSDVLTLPSGFPAASTAAMPLSSTLQPIDLGYRYKRFDLGASWIGWQDFSYRVSVRHDVRDGTKPTSGSFFNTASQLASPVNQVTDQVEVSASYATRRIQATLGYQASMFRNDHEALTWSNPFVPVVPGSSIGQLALAPDNQFHQVTGSAGYDITPTIRVSGDFAAGRMTQDAAYLAPTLNAALAPTVPALPVQSLSGRADTFSGSVKITAAPWEGIRLNASYARDRRDNKTPIQSYPSVATDMFLEPLARSNTPFGFTQDRYKIGGDYRGPGSMRWSVGAEQDNRERSYQEVVNTRETTLWGRVGMQARDDLSVSLKLAHSGRNNSAYGTSVWFGYPENPLLRKFYLADRERDSAAARAEYAYSEKVSLSRSADYANDDYNHSLVGLNSARSLSIGADLSVAISERTQVHAFAQGERIRSRQTGSQAFAGPDWTGRNKDSFDVLGVSVKHAAIVDKLDIGADLTISRSRSDVAVEDGSASAPFPAATAKVDSLKLYATYKLKDNLSLTGSYWYERYDSQDWRLDGIAPATIGNLLTFGAQPPNYSVNVLRVAMRYRF
ncbi:MAG: MtrB/PioB family decaheme-associated outer membrane protein [Caldimonas sp.]